MKVFRWIWRVNSVLILVSSAAVAIAVGNLLWSELGRSRSREGSDVVPAAAGRAGPKLRLTRLAPVDGVPVLRGELLADAQASGFSSGPSAETRNILYVDTASGHARWLLPDDDHVITDHLEMSVEQSEPPRSRRQLASVALVKLATDDESDGTGTLLLVAADGARQLTISTGVRAVHSASVEAGTLRLLYEREKKLYLAAYESSTFQKSSETPIDVPSLQ